MPDKTSGCMERVADSNEIKWSISYAMARVKTMSLTVFQSPHSPLSAVGRQQAERIAERVSHLSFDALPRKPPTNLKAKKPLTPLQKSRAKSRSVSRSSPSV